VTVQPILCKRFIDTIAALQVWKSAISLRSCYSVSSLCSSGSCIIQNQHNVYTTKGVANYDLHLNLSNGSNCWWLSGSRRV